MAQRRCYARSGKESGQEGTDAVSRRLGVRSWWQRLRAGLRLLRAGVPGLSVLLRAAGNYIRHQSANQAGSVAFSSVLAMFPLLLFLSAAAGFVGQPGAAAELASRVVEFAPPAVADALKPVIDQLLRERSPAWLTIGMFATVWAASSGAQAIRTALNKAYGVEQGLTFWQARIKVTLFTVIGTIGAVLVFSSVVILPYAWALLEKAAGLGADALWLRTGVRYGLALVVLVDSVRPPLRLAAGHPATPVDRAAGGGARRADVARRRGDPLLYPAQCRQARRRLWQLCGPGGDPGLSLRERRDLDLRSGDQRRASRARS